MLRKEEQNVVTSNSEQLIVQLLTRSRDVSAINIMKLTPSHFYRYKLR